MTQEMMDQKPTYTIKTRNVVRDVQSMADIYDVRVATKQQIIDRLADIFGDDPDLARTVYDYAVSGHLSYHNQLCERFKQCHRGKGQ